MRSNSTAVVRRRHAGFSLMEMLVATAITGALVTTAVPSVTSLLRSSRVASQLNGFLADLRYARGQAILRGQGVSVCASLDGARCAEGSDWQRGWIVFVDADGDGRRDGSGAEPVLRRQFGWANDDRFVADPEVTAISFARSGFARGMKASRVMLTLRAPAVKPALTRCVAVNLVGHAAVLPADSQGCGG